ncbi:MAG: cysteine hydrolase [Acidihalobacter sp.]|uniref:cysteine hydrolase n=1 Tax=Acidihalobacter sp. TaxID=1872108 RepID=UPI00307E74DF
MSSIDSLQPRSGRAALLMIEFVNEWLADDGKLRFLMADNTAALDSSLSAAWRVLHSARSSALPVFHATLKFSPDYRELGTCDFGLRGAIRRGGRFKATDGGCQFHPDFTPASGEFVIEGRSGASAFANSNLDGLMRANGITRLFLAGYATHVCVESTLRAAHDMGYEPVVIIDATAAFSAAQQDYFIEHVVHHFGHLISSDTFVNLENRKTG